MLVSTEPHTAPGGGQWLSKQAACLTGSLLGYSEASVRLDLQFSGPAVAVESLWGLGALSYQWVC